jgi:arginine:ornithine antiporter/lysine permease
LTNTKTVATSEGAKTVSNQKLGLVAVTTLVVSAMIGGGAFNLPQNMAQSASLVAELISWVISGLGVFFLARTFQVLSDIKPELTAGIYMYSRKGFGQYAGFQIAWGYWLAAVFGNVAFGVLLMDTINYFFPPYFKGGNTWEAILGASVVFWLMNWLVLRGVKGASALNVIGTVAKIIPILVFIAVLLFAMKAGLWTSAFWGHVATTVTSSTNAHAAAAKPLGSLLEQVKSTMLITLWVYIGIEGAVVMSDKSDATTVSRATLLGFLVTTVLYVLLSVLPFGVESQAALSTIAPPSMAPILGAIVGKWGEYLVNAGVIISVLSSWVVWTLIVAELPWAGAKDGSFPKVFAKTNKNGAPTVSLWVSTVIMQLGMILVYFSNSAWNLMLSIVGVMILPAYIGSTGYLWKLIATGQYPAKARIGKLQALITSIIATIYGAWTIYAGGLQYMLSAMIFFALGNVVYVWSRKEHAPDKFPFNKYELVAALVIVATGIAAVIMLFTHNLKQVYSG